MPSPGGGAGQGAFMDWARILAYVTGTVDQELLARNEYLAAGPAQNVVQRWNWFAEPRSGGALPAQDGHLMSHGDVFVLQREATTNPEREQGAEGGQKREHADDGMTASPKTLCFSAFWSFEQAQPSGQLITSTPLSVV